ncbi:MAG: acyl-CoA dehydrogenase [Myxococcales bacterium]|nr:acyl-CoA dehydrogenase [Myxococcales bacterium]
MTIKPLTILTEDETMFQDAVYQYAREQIGPKVSEMDEAGKIDGDIIPGLFQLGLMGVEVPENLGGAGGSFFSAILAVEALARVDPSVSVFVDVQNTLVNNALLNFASPALQARYLPKMCAEWVGSYALSESSSGSDAFALKTRATLDGDSYILNGSKLWITNGAEASLFIVMANVDPSKGYRGITSFIVERDTPGLKIGKKEDKLGIRASSTVELIFEDCKVPAENVIGEVGKGYKIAIETLNEGRIGIGAQMIGLAQGALDHAMAYMLDRQQFGRPIAEFQGLEFQYAQVATEIEAARLMVYNAARLKDAKQPFVKEAAMAKLFSSQVAERAASMCLEFMGGVGFTKEYPAEKFYRDAKIGKIYEGTSNMQLATIGKLMRQFYSSRISG